MVNISREAEENITRILKDVRQQSLATSDSDSGSSQQLPSTSQGACGFGPCGGQDTTDFAAAGTSSSVRMDTATQVHCSTGHVGTGLMCCYNVNLCVHVIADLKNIVVQMSWAQILAGSCIKYFSP